MRLTQQRAEYKAIVYFVRSVNAWLPFHVLPLPEVPVVAVNFVAVGR